MFASIPRWLRVVVFTQIALVFAIPIGGWILQRTGEAADLAKYPPPGKLVELSGRRIHIYCEGQRGSGSLVILNADLGDHALIWRAVQSALSGGRGNGDKLRSCAVDRAGLGWSDPGPDDRSINASARELRRALEAAGEPGPYILVGHGLGALHVALLARENPTTTAALVLVDPLPPECLNVRLDGIAARTEEEHREAVRAKLSEVIAERGPCPEGEGGTALLSGLARVGMVRALAGRNFDATSPTPELLPIHRALKLRTQATDAMLQESRTAYVGLRDAQDVLAGLGAVRLRVISRGRTGNFVEDQEFLNRRADAPTLAFERAQLAYLQRRHVEMAALPNAAIVVAKGSGHYIPISEPALVAATILESAGLVASTPPTTPPTTN